MLRDAGNIAKSGQIVDFSLTAGTKQRNPTEEKDDIMAGQIPKVWKGKPEKLRQKDLDARSTVKFTKAKPQTDGTSGVREITRITVRILRNAQTSPFPPLATRTTFRPTASMEKALLGAIEPLGGRAIHISSEWAVDDLDQADLFFVQRKKFLEAKPTLQAAYLEAIAARTLRVFDAIRYEDIKALGQYHMTTINQITAYAAVLGGNVPYSSIDNAYEDVRPELGALCVRRQPESHV